MQRAGISTWFVYHSSQNIAPGTQYLLNSSWKTDNLILNLRAEAWSCFSFLNLCSFIIMAHWPFWRYPPLSPEPKDFISFQPMPSHVHRAETNRQSRAKSIQVGAGLKVWKVTRHITLLLREVERSWVRNLRLKLSGKGQQGEKDQNSKLHTQRSGEIISEHYSLQTQRTRKLTGGFLYPIAHALIMVSCAIKIQKSLHFPNI